MKSGAALLQEPQASASAAGCGFDLGWQLWEFERHWTGVRRAGHSALRLLRCDHICFQIAIRCRDQAGAGPQGARAAKPVGMAAQCNFTKAFGLRELRLCTARAINSFPVPVSGRTAP